MTDYVTVSIDNYIVLEWWYPSPASSPVPKRWKQYFPRHGWIEFTLCSF